MLRQSLIQSIDGYKASFSESETIFIRSWPSEFKISGWFVRLQQEGHQDSHIHPGGWLSGVVYLKTTDKNSPEGAIEFGLHGYGYPRFKEESPTFLHQPVVGDIVLFPSSLFHRTIKIKSDNERCVIAFDLLPFKKSNFAKTFF